jgi:hypothetical protein
LRGIHFEQFKKLPVYYKGILVGDYEADPSASSGHALSSKTRSSWS